MDLHKITIKQFDRHMRLKIDDMELKGLIDYEIKSPAGKRAELLIRLAVSEIDLGFDNGGDNLSGNLGEGAE